MTKRLPLLCLSILLLLSACSNNNTMLPHPDISSVSILESGLETSEIAETDSKTESVESSPLSLRQNLLEEAQGPIPDFLDAEQQALYARAKTAYMEFTLDNSGFGSGGGDGPELEQDDMQYYKCNGSITKWTDFEDAMLSVFTAGYFEELNNRASYTDGNGVYHERTIFMEHNGDLYYSGGARGGNMTFVGPETFEFISKDDNKNQFYVVGTYDDYAQDANGELIKEDTGEYQRAGNPVTEKHLIVMERGSDGWRFSEFQLAY